MTIKNELDKLRRSRKQMSGHLFKILKKKKTINVEVQRKKEHETKVGGP